MMQIPRRLSHHVPTVPIKDSEQFVEVFKVKFCDLDSDEFQMYKRATEDEYCLNKNVKWEIVGKPKFSFKRSGKGLPTDVEIKLIELLQGNEALPEEIIKLLLQILTDDNVYQINEMVRDGTPLENIIKYFLKVKQICKL